MINVKYAKKFCNEDITQIENYDEAINDDTQTWDCHHRRETNEGLSVKNLKELGLYFNRPASELIFLTRAEHNILHHKGKKGPNCGKHFSEEHKQNLSKSQKGRKSLIEGKHKVWDDKLNNKFHYEF